VLVAEGRLLISGVAGENSEVVVKLEMEEADVNIVGELVAVEVGGFVVATIVRISASDV